MKIYSTVADALTLGTNDLKIDGVLLVAEHGNYQRNEKGQHQYPRYELFKQIVSVYRTTEKTAPVFNDKHLSWNWDWCQRNVRSIERIGLRVHGRILFTSNMANAVEMPLDSEIEEAEFVTVGLTAMIIMDLKRFSVWLNDRGGECG